VFRLFLAGASACRPLDQQFFRALAFGRGFSPAEGTEDLLDVAKSALSRLGWGKYGQLGCGPNVKQAKVPTEVKTASPVTSVSCGKGLDPVIVISPPCCTLVTFGPRFPTSFSHLQTLNSYTHFSSKRRADNERSQRDRQEVYRLCERRQGLRYGYCSRSHLAQIALEPLCSLLRHNFPLFCRLVPL
jgi:hypothetical protein